MTALRWPVAMVVALALAGCGADGEEDAPDQLVELGAEEPTDADDPVEEPPEEPADDPAEEADDPAGEPLDPDVADEVPPDAVLATATTDHGEIVVDGDGMTLYLFDQDRDGTSACYDDCAATWPPLEAPVTAEGSVDEDLVGETQRDDGVAQVTYGGHPLYYFAGDEATGDVEGQGVGDVWWVVSADGDRVTGADHAGESGDGDAPVRDY